MKILMICKECEKEGKESKVYPGSVSTTWLEGTEYYDEKGIYHNHDPNYDTKNYSCSNGHNWNKSYLHKCPNCDYGKELEKK